MRSGLAKSMCLAIVFGLVGGCANTPTAPTPAGSGSLAGAQLGFQNRR